MQTYTKVSVKVDEKKHMMKIVVVYFVLSARVWEE